MHKKLEGEEEKSFFFQVQKVSGGEQKVFYPPSPHCTVCGGEGKSLKKERKGLTRYSVPGVKQSILYSTRKDAWKWVKFEARKLRLFEARFPVFDVPLYLFTFIRFFPFLPPQNTTMGGGGSCKGFETVSPRFCPLKIARAERNSFPLKNARFPTGKGNKKAKAESSPYHHSPAAVSPPPPLLARSRLTKFSPLNMGREVGRSETSYSLFPLFRHGPPLGRVCNLALRTTEGEKVY